MRVLINSVHITFWIVFWSDLWYRRQAQASDDLLKLFRQLTYGTMFCSDI
jgi:hypothetical protein